MTVIDGYVVIDKADIKRNFLSYHSDRKKIEEYGLYVEALSIENLDLRGLIIRRSKFVNCQFINCNFGFSEMDQWHALNCSFSKCIFDNTHLNDGIFENTSFIQCDLAGASCYDSTYIGSNLSSNKLCASFSRSDLRFCNFENSDFSNASFRNAKLFNNKRFNIIGEPSEIDETMVDFSEAGDGSRMITLREAMSLLRK
ncbi:MAG: pentapeptide repeat-containing protein [Bacteroidota bacterium]|nr:pentapeptide repeat-containing protein [Bacteroidota bacterium]